MKYLRKSYDTLREDGLYSLLKKGIPFLYNRHLVPLSPRMSPICNSEFNSVDINIVHGKDRPNYESGLISGIDEFVSPGDDVVVGGGRGVTAVEAAKTVGDSGSVSVYEGAEENIERIQETIRINHVSGRVNVTHAVIGPELNLYGEKGDAIHIPPEKIPDCDVVELDCEGSELDILENLTIRPRVILVETHGIYDAPSDEVEKLLNKLSYSVVSREIAAEDHRASCIEDDIRVLSAVLE